VLLFLVGKYFLVAFRRGLLDGSIHNNILVIIIVVLVVVGSVPATAAAAVPEPAAG
jgi:hypothetical protein